MKSLVRRVTADPDAAEELAAEAFTEALIGLDNLRDLSVFGSWVCSIAMNLCRRYFSRRTAHRNLRAMLEVGSPLQEDPQRLAELREMNEWILRAVNALPESLRVATVLFYYESLSTREIADLLGVSVGAVKTRLSRSRSRLRDTIVNRYNEEYFLSYAERRAKNMIEVEVIDVFQMRGQNQYGVLLLDRAVPRVLPFMVGQAEGKAMALSSRAVDLGRPMTYQLVSQLIEAAGGTVDHVRIEALRGSTYFAVIVVRSDGVLHEVDSRPSDAINIAICAKRPIYANPELLDRNGIELPFDRNTVFEPRGMLLLEGQATNGISAPRMDTSSEGREQGRKAVLEYVKSLVAEK